MILEYKYKQNIKFFFSLWHKLPIYNMKLLEYMQRPGCMQTPKIKKSFHTYTHDRKKMQKTGGFFFLHDSTLLSTFLAV